MSLKKPKVSSGTQWVIDTQIIRCLNIDKIKRTVARGPPAPRRLPQHSVLRALRLAWRHLGRILSRRAHREQMPPAPRARGLGAAGGWPSRVAGSVHTCPRPSVFTVTGPATGVLLPVTTWEPRRQGQWACACSLPAP